MSLPPFPERVGHAPDDVTSAIRSAIANATAAGALAADPPAREETIGGIRCLVFTPPHTPRGTVLHFHGGGYRVGAPEVVASFARALSDACGVELICPAYRLAPDYPFPAAINDGWKVWTAAAERASHPILLSGDSAGGGLAAALVALAAAGGPKIDGLILLSAWLDLSVSSDCYVHNAATDPVFSRQAAAAAAEMYLQGAPAAQPAASPLLATLAHFPPTLINVGEGEVLADDSARFHEALSAVGVPVTMHRVPGMEHVAVTRNMAAEGSAETFEALRIFVHERIGALTPVSAT